MFNLSETAKWGIGLGITILLQTFAVGWFVSGLSSQVERNVQDISNLKSGAAVYLTREQLEDILGARDQKLVNIENAVTRLETKFDSVFHPVGNQTNIQ